MKSALAISDLGQSHYVFIIDPDYTDQDTPTCSVCRGPKRFALVYDPEYNSLAIRQWEYDLFKWKDSFLSAKFFINRLVIK